MSILEAHVFLSFWKHCHETLKYLFLIQTSAKEAHVFLSFWKHYHETLKQLFNPDEHQGGSCFFVFLKTLPWHLEPIVLIQMSILEAQELRAVYMVAVISIKDWLVSYKSITPRKMTILFVFLSLCLRQTLFYNTLRNGCWLVLPDLCKW